MWRTVAEVVLWVAAFAGYSIILWQLLSLMSAATKFFKAWTNPHININHRAMTLVPKEVKKADMVN